MAHTEETKRKLKELWKIQHPNFVPPLKGKKHSEKTIQLIKEKLKGLPPSHLGHKHTLESRKKMSETKRLRGSAVSGPAHHSFKDGKLQERRDARFSKDYKRWRYDVFMRDSFTCQKCGDSRGGNLVAHHIKPFSEYPELRFEVSNGLTVCETCHEKIHYG